MKNNEKIVVLTAYSYPIAKILDEVNIDMILVGDSGVMVELGKTSTKEAALTEMLIFTQAVSRGAKNTLIIGDMPIGSYQNGNALENAKKFIESGAHAIKVEGTELDAIKLLKENNIEVMGHLGLLPQTAQQYKVVRDDSLINQAKELEKAGVFSIVLECIPAVLAKKITASISIPTIGIGAGIHCDGQVLVTNDLLGMYEMKTKFVRKYFDFNSKISEALKKFSSDVKDGSFPNSDECFK